MTWQMALRQGEDFLAEMQIADSAVDAWYLLEYCAEIDRTWFLLNREEEIPDPIYQRYQEFLRKRSLHIPLQHLTGEQEFMGLPFHVNENVLIPRQDTETLVEEVLGVIKKHDRVLDLCTGSGCIVISVVKMAEDVTGVGADLSEKALEVARENARNLQADVTFIKSNLFDQVEGKFDCIVSNPPYIATAQIDSLMEEVRDHEPRMALDGREDGLFFYREIVAKSQEHLKENGWLLFEIGCDQAEAVSGMMRQAGYEHVRVKKDLAGLDRVVMGQRG
ncbi:MAG: peptide chain release factor N(5)-glutamine methyltransferase [Lachnospiraceae bacterium]|nr:peptide chain release factor N(5)-glutamine methyltransferase [Robinsoniella sp.]MDY3767796.1 peptide chain release factor N(5)-glutamine methyltransferase [Lachnospiraceae bacterium]